MHYTEITHMDASESVIAALHLSDMVTHVLVHAWLANNIVQE